MRITESTTKLKVTFVDKREKSTILGLIDSYKDNDKFVNFFWNCTCINQAKQVADTIKKGDFVIIKSADIMIKKDKGSMLVFSLDVTSSPYEKKETTLVSKPTTENEYDYDPAGTSDTDDEPF